MCSTEENEHICGNRFSARARYIKKNRLLTFRDNTGYILTEGFVSLAQEMYCTIPIPFVAVMVMVTRLIILRSQGLKSPSFQASDLFHRNPRLILDNTMFIAD